MKIASIIDYKLCHMVLGTWSKMSIVDIIRRVNVLMIVC